MRIVLLNTKIHVRANFSCGNESLNLYLKKQANQDMKKNLAACFVLLDGNDNIIKGYYTLSSDSIDRDEVPEAYKNRTPSNYNVPVTLLGRLARDITMKSKGAGEFLLIDALMRSYNISRNSIASMAVIVDPLDNIAVDFYSKYGFTMLPESCRMFIPMKTIAKLFEG